MTHFETVDDNTKYIQIDKIEVYRDFVVQDASSLAFEYILEYLKILTSTSIFGIVLDSYNSELELENTDGWIFNRSPLHSKGFFELWSSIQ